MRLGEKRGFDFECEGRILAHSVFSLRTPLFTGAQANSASVYLRRGVSRHAKPLIIAAAPMEIVIDFRAIVQRLLGYFACGCGGAIEHQYRKSAPAQRQRKENGSVLAKECSAVSARRPKVIDAPLWRIFFGGHPVSFVRKQKKWGGKAATGLPVTLPQQRQRKENGNVLPK